MRSLLKRILPDFIVNIVRRIKSFYYHGFRLLKLYYLDYKRFSNAGFRLRTTQTKENLRSRITFYYHSIEKGLSHPNIRLGFGRRALTALFTALDEYKNAGFDISDIRYRTGLSTIKTYIEYHADKDVDISDIISKFSSFNVDINEQYGGANTFSKDEVLRNRDASFDVFSKSRISVRDYEDSPVEFDKLKRALDLSVLAPSVCNRQSWRIHVINDKAIQKKVLIAQAGLNGFGQNIQSLIMICSDTQVFSGPEERNQAYIDGGIYAMNLLYSLEFVGLAGCALNANLKIENEQQIRRILNVPQSEVIIMFISVGNYPNQFKAPKSQRDDSGLITRYY